MAEPQKQKIRLTAAAYLTFEEVSGRASTVEQFRSELSKFTADGILFLCGILSNLLFRDSPYLSQELHDGLLRALFPPDLVATLLAQNRVVFHRQQLLFVAKQAIRLHPGGGTYPKPGLPLARVFLMANDHLPPAFREPKGAREAVLQGLAHCIPVSEACETGRHGHRVLRPYLLLEQFMGPKQSGVYFDIPKLFGELVGLPVRTYFGLLFGVLTKLMSFDVKQLVDDRETFGVDEGFFRTAAVPATEVDRFLSSVSTDPATLATLASTSGSNDYTCFKDKPMFTRSGRLYPVDVAFFAAKGEGALFWTIFETLDDKDKSQFQQYWGDIFENYVTWILQRSTRGSVNNFVPDPRYELDESAQVCDGIILCGTSLILLEYKGGMFQADAKYSGRTDLLDAEIEKKLVGTEGKRKGLRQLAWAISSIFDREEPARVKGLDLKNVSTVYPVLVVRDAIAGAMFLNQHLARRFRQFINHKAIKPRTLAPLFCLSIDHLEKMADSLRVASMAKILEARYKPDRALIYPFDMVENPFIAPAQRLPSFLDEALDKLCDGIIREFFPEASLPGRPESPG